MDEKKKWTVKDVITTVLLSAVLIVIQLVVNMVCMANDFVSMVLSVGITSMSVCFLPLLHWWRFIYHLVRESVLTVLKCGGM